MCARLQAGSPRALPHNQPAAGAAYYVSLPHTPQPNQHTHTHACTFTNTRTHTHTFVRTDGALQELERAGHLPLRRQVPGARWSFGSVCESVRVCVLCVWGGTGTSGFSCDLRRRLSSTMTQNKPLVQFAHGTLELTPADAPAASTQLPSHPLANTSPAVCARYAGAAPADAPAARQERPLPHLCCHRHM